MPRHAKHWCFTLNNYTEDELSELRALGNELPEPVVFLVFGRETGQNGTPHLQGYIAFSTRKTLAYAKSVTSARAHLEPCRGTPAQNEAYCTKDGDFEKFGVRPGGAGTRSDLHDVAKAVQEGKRLREIAEEHPSSFLRYGGGILRLRQFIRPTRSGPPVIHVFWGKTGTGKTRRVHEFVNPEELWIHSGYGQWFDGYDSHKAVLFDDFDGSWFPITFFLKLLDRYVLSVPVKGAFTWWNPSTIYITANHHPREWYGNAKEEHQNALMRRIREFGTISECT